MILSSLKNRTAAATIGARVLTVIVFTEASIMAAFYLLGADSSSIGAGVVDTLMLAIISTLVIYLWVIRPLKYAKQQNELFNTLVNNIDVGMVVTDPRAHGVITYVNPAFTRITGYAFDEVIGRNPRLLHGDDTIESARQQTRAAIREGRAVRVLQRNCRKDGTPFWNDLHLNPVTGADGAIYQWVGLINDVTAQREMEQQNERWASAMQQSAEAVCVFNDQGVIEFANESFCDNVGLSLALVVGIDVRRFCSEDDHAEDSAGESMSESMALKQPWSARHRCVRADGSCYEALSSMTPIAQQDGSLAFVAVHRDITDMAAVEAQLRQSQKMEAVGLLVGGIAHDFNNVLAGILGNLYLLRRHIQDDPQMQKRLEGVEKQGYAAAGMLRQLLSFSRKGEPEVKVMDLAPFSKELVKFARVSVPESITLTCRLEVRHLILRCDPVQLQQSLLNLIVNAMHAVQKRGNRNGYIELTIDDVAPPAELYALKTCDTWARICVRDNGIGMDAATREKIFEPFFTTKVSGIGTGLGLAMVQGYLESLHGLINVESQPGVGTSVSIWLPASPAEQPAINEQDVSVRQGGGELLLLADDDELVLLALTEILESANYRVLRASSGAGALRLFEEHGARLHMAILDVVMPDGTGIEVARQMQQSRHDLPIVFMTGYDRQSTLLSSEHASHLMLRKPWDIAQLNRVLERSLVL